MRKRLIAAVSAAAVLCLGVGIAFAQTGDNIYTVDLATTKPAGKGSPSKPIPVKLGFGYEVSAEGGLRPTPIRQYRIAPEGLVTYPKLFKGCKFAEAARLPEPSGKCKKASLGKGIVRNQFGATSLREPAAQVPCNLRLRLYNLTDAGKNGGMAIRLDGGPGQKPDPGCPNVIQETIKAKFFNVKYQGLKTSELRFDVQRNLYEPVIGLSNAVIDVTSTVNKKTAKTKVKGKTRTVGYYSKIGCKGKTRAVRVEFVDLDDNKFTATKTGRC
jgi:hypothetical protein